MAGSLNYKAKISKWVANIQYQWSQGEPMWNREKFLTTQGAKRWRAPFSHPAMYTLVHTHREKLPAFGELHVPCGCWSLGRKQNGVFTMISGVGTIAILFLIQTSLQLHGYTVPPTGGQNHVLMKPVPWATQETKVSTALHLWAWHHPSEHCRKGSATCDFPWDPWLHFHAWLVQLLHRGGKPNLPA